MVKLLFAKLAEYWNFPFGSANVSNFFQWSWCQLIIKLWMYVVDITRI